MKRHTKRYIDNGDTPTTFEKWMGCICGVLIICAMATFATRIVIDLRAKQAQRNAPTYHQQLPTPAFPIG